MPRLFILYNGYLSRKIGINASILPEIWIQKIVSIQNGCGGCEICQDPSPPPRRRAAHDSIIPSIKTSLIIIARGFWMESLAAPHATSTPFLFHTGGQSLDLYPILKEGANMHRIRAAIARETGDPLTGYNAIYHRIRRFLKRLESAGYLISERGIFDYGLDEKPCTWWRPTSTGLNLIRQVQNSNPCKLPRDPDTLEGDTSPTVARGAFRTRYPYDTDEPRTGDPPVGAVPRRGAASPGSKRPSLLCQVRNDFLPNYKRRLFERLDTGRVDPKTGKPITVVNPLLKAKLADIRDYYNYYLEEIEDKTIVLVNKDAESPRRGLQNPPLPDPL